MLIRFLIATFLIGVSGASQGTLINRGGGMIYDDVLDITWLQNASQGAGSVFDFDDGINDGLMLWNSATQWAASLDYGGFVDWRLPSMDLNGDQSDTVFGEGIVDCATATEVECRDNELGYMFYYNLMGSFADDLTGSQGPFMNIQIAHWSQTQIIFPGLEGCWYFAFSGGANGEEDFPCVGGPLGFGAWGVRNGDVGPQVAEPAVLALFGLGLAGLGIVRLRERPGR